MFPLCILFLKGNLRFDKEEFHSRFFMEKYFILNRKEKFSNRVLLIIFKYMKMEFVPPRGCLMMVMIVPCLVVVMNEAIRY